jgi:flagellin
MALSLINNVASLTAQNNLNRTQQSLSTSLERLSSGLKINRGADGPAALVQSEQLRAQIAGLNTAVDNTNKAVSLVQTGEGALNEINSLLGKVRSLVLDSANAGVNDTNALAANQAEINNALGTITSIANQTQFGTKKLLDGSRALSVSSSLGTATATAAGTVSSGSYGVTITSAATAANVQGGAITAANVSAGRQETLTVNGVNINFTQTATAAGSLAAAQTAVNAASAQTGVRAIIDNVTGGNTQLRLYSTSFGTGHTISVSSSQTSGNSVLGTVAGSVDGSNIAGSIGGVAASGVGAVLTANSGPAAGVQVTYAPTVATDTFTSAAANSFTTDNTASTQTVNANNALVFQIGANAGQTAQIALSDSRSSALGQGVSSNATNLSQIDVTKLASSPNLSSDFLNVVDKAISDVTGQRAQLGAFQANTLQSNANNLQTTLQNTTAAESTVRDTNYAMEIANYTKLQTQMQAGQTVLSNSNQIPSLVASLLRG